MTTVAAPEPQVAPPEPQATPPRAMTIARGLGRTAVAVLGAIVIFGVFMKLKGADPFTAYRDMWDSTFASSDSIEQILVKYHPGDKISVNWVDQSGQSQTATVTLANGPAALRVAMASGVS